MNKIVLVFLISGLYITGLFGSTSINNQNQYTHLQKSFAKSYDLDSFENIPIEKRVNCTGVTKNGRKYKIENFKAIVDYQKVLLLPRQYSIVFLTAKKNYSVYFNNRDLSIDNIDYQGMTSFNNKKCMKSAVECLNDAFLKADEKFTEGKFSVARISADNKLIIYQAQRTFKKNNQDSFFQCDI